MEVHAKDCEGNTSLHLSILEKKEDMAILIISLSNDLNIQNSQGNTPLHLSVLSENYRITRHLLLNNANPAICNNSTKTPQGSSENTEITHLFSRKLPPNSLKYFLLILCFLTFQSLVFAIIDQSYIFSNNLLLFSGILYLFNIALFFLLYLCDPGYEFSNKSSLVVIEYLGIVWEIQPRIRVSLLCSQKKKICTTLFCLQKMC